MGFWDEMLNTPAKESTETSSKAGAGQTLYEKHAAAFSLYLDQNFCDFQQELEYHDRIGDLDERNHLNAVEKAAAGVVVFFEQKKLLRKAHTEDFLKIFLHLLLGPRKGSPVSQSDRNKIFAAALEMIDQKMWHHDGKLDKLYYKMLDGFPDQFLGYAQEEILNRLDSTRLVKERQSKASGTARNPLSHKQIVEHFKIHNIFDEMELEYFLQNPRAGVPLFSFFLNVYWFKLWGLLGPVFSFLKGRHVPGFTQAGVSLNPPELIGQLLKDQPPWLSLVLFWGVFLITGLFFLSTWGRYVRKRGERKKMLKNFQNLVLASQISGPALQQSLQEIFPRASEELLQGLCRKARVRI